ncbi:S8 family serine peptidase [Bacillus sp. CGMCC 1.16607]|uniref:S8 family peptidase n=1 Tax=Bacillus sp. CGMCC 1.16607 TaxID=3351842 RepID=UPI003635409A
MPWGHSNLNLQAKEPSTLTGKGVKVAVIDTGVDMDHPDLAVKGGKCVLDEIGACDRSYDDEEGHGTHVAGIIAAQDNGIGVVGIAPEAEIYAVKSLDDEGTGTSTTIMAGIQWAIDHQMDIINLSLTTPYEDYGIKQMVDKAYKSGILVIAAAGNVGTASGYGNTVQYPAKFPSVIAVAATNQFNVRIPTSSTGEEVELAAPGDAIYSTVSGGGYGTMRGTSMAAPHVAGLAALYMEKYPDASNIEIRKKLEMNAKDLGVPGKDSFYGAGLAQADTTVDSSEELPVTYTADDKGTIRLNLKSVLEKYEAYNLYRFDRLIMEKSSDASVVDYAGQGPVSYRVHPVEYGVENRDVEISIEVDVAGPYFSDMSNEAWYNRYLTYLYSEKVINGYGENKIKPGQLVTRAEAVTMLGRALNLSGTARPSRFKDVGAASFASGYIESAADLGIIKGRLDGTFHPEQPVTRAEMAILLARAYEFANVKDVRFSDVKSGMAGYKEILELAGAQITEGYPDGTFRPSETMNRATYAVFLAKARQEEFR